MEKALPRDKPCKVLLIEDDEVDRLSLIRTIDNQPDNFESHHVSRIDDATAVLEKNEFDIIISDMHLPDSRGIETINTLLGLSHRTPIVVLSGEDNDTIALQAVNAGAQDYISKRYISDGSLLTRTLRHAIERHQMKLKLEMARDRAKYLAQYDQCTSLPNRLLFLDRLNQAIMRAVREKEHFALCFIDLDKFKAVNDTLGHEAGDEVLRRVANRMTKSLRSSDTIARYGGDEFAVILQNVNSDLNIETLGLQLIELVSRPISINNNLCQVGVSMGVACYPKHGLNSDALLKHADIAMYEAKHSRSNQIRFFSQALLEGRAPQQTLEEALINALLNPDKHFDVVYQPIMHLHDNRAFATEAFIRWKHPLLGIVMPEKFIALAEEIGVVEKIDEWVFSNICKLLAKTPNRRIALNISVQSFNRQDFTSNVIEPNLKRYGVSGEQIEIDVTEQLILENNEFIIKQMDALKALGIQIAIDDFGTGFSSLSYLNRFPIDILKIDGSFICDAESTEKDQALLKAIIALGRTMGLRLIAECVETEAQKKHLQKIGCDYAQGFLWGQPEKSNLRQ